MKIFISSTQLHHTSSRFLNLFTTMKMFLTSCFEFITFLVVKKFRKLSGKRRKFPKFHQRRLLTPLQDNKNTIFNFHSYFHLSQVICFYILSTFFGWKNLKFVVMEMKRMMWRKWKQKTTFISSFEWGRKEDKNKRHVRNEFLNFFNIPRKNSQFKKKNYSKTIVQTMELIKNDEFV